MGKLGKRGELVAEIGSRLIETDSQENVFNYVWLNDK